MLPILKEEGLSCLFFVTAESAKSSSSMLWHEELYAMLKSAPRDPLGIPIDILGTRAKVQDGNRRREAWWKLVREFSKVGHENRQELIDHLRQELGLKRDWNTFIRENPALKKRFILLSLSDLEVLKNAGMTLGSHTFTHPILSLLPRSAAQHEIEESRNRLEQELNIQVWALSYPFGDPASVTSREMTMAKRAGYRCAFVNSGGLVPSQMEKRFHLQRVHVSADMTIAEFEAHVSGFHGMLQKKFLHSMGVSNWI
jgi:peptidoglycan/xylan/chitin deacetylase (PgdA/CDA1 family)